MKLRRVILKFMGIEWRAGGRRIIACDAGLVSILMRAERCIGA
jgi:hypothetical protein